MIITGNEDLRVQKTVREIKRAYKSLLCERPHDEISVKELCERASINKKTFYHYYKSVNALLSEIQLEYAYDFLRNLKEYVMPEELAALNQEFFLFADRQDKAFDCVMLAYPYIDIEPLMNLLKNRLSWNKFRGFRELTNYEQDMLINFTVHSVLNSCRQWIKDNKSVALKQVVSLTNRLVDDGARNFF